MIALIVAHSKNRVIGCNGQIPWDIKGEKKRFRQLTTGNVVIMGRRTYEEIGRPLPNRYMVLVSTTIDVQMDNCITATSLEEAVIMAREKFGEDKDIFISGGERLYMEAIDIVDKMFVTEIDAYIEGDTFFPEFDEKGFYRYEEEYVDGDIPYTYVTYVRK